MKYKVEMNNAPDLEGTLFTIGFGDEPATNNELVKAASERLSNLEEAGSLTGGKLALLNGRASLPVGAVLTHKLSHLYGALGVFDPKMGGYVIAVSHDPDYPVGSVVSA